MPDTWIEILLKFKPIQLEEGSIVFQTVNSPFLFWGLLTFLILSLITFYYLSKIYSSNQFKAISLGIRIVALCLVFLPFFEPSLLSPDVIPNENFIAVMVDHSASMGIPDGYFGDSRYEDVRKILYHEDNEILSELERDFKIRYYAFSGSATRIDSLSNLTPQGIETNLTASFQRVLSDFKGLPLAGIVLFTDGGDNSLENPRRIAEELKFSNTPLHIVGLGKEHLEQDRELLEVKTNRGIQPGSGAEIEVKVRSWIEESEPAVFNIYSGEKLVFTKQVNLKGNGKIDHFSFFFDPEEEESVEYTVQISPLPNEVNTENNSLNILIDSKKDTIRVLYFEGHLRTEFKFIKRALEEDQIVDFTSISQTGTGKYYRQGIKNPEELKGGFPSDEEELYQYKAIIFGDIDASSFSIEQLEMIEKFVRKRGGGFLMLGGKNSFAEGDYWNTPIADILPVEIDPQRKTVISPNFNDPNIPKEERGFQFVPTQEGLENPILKLVPDPIKNRRVWNTMPRLFSINYFGAKKPAATILAEKPQDRFGNSEPLFVVQRYGRGRTAVLATASTWRWQMLLEANDTKHERFWRQFIRWLGDGAPNHVSLSLAHDRVEPNVEIPIRVSLFDENFDPLSEVEVTGIMTDPNKNLSQMQFLPELNEEGEYTFNFVPKTTGMYSIEVESKLNGKIIGKQYQSIISRPSKKEFYNATLKKGFLKNMAALANGYYYEPAEVGNIPVNLKSRKSSTSIIRSEYIWDMPLLFLLIVILLSAEWIYRRYKGLP